MNMTRAKKWHALILVLASGVLSVSNLQAAQVSYNLTLSNGNQYVPDGTAYARVTIDDEGSSGLINFTVSILPSILTANKTANFGLQSFGFNLLTPGDATSLAAGDITGLPSGWGADVSLNPPSSGGTAQDGFGKFDVVVRDGGSNRIDPDLTFSIDLGSNQTTTDHISDYSAASSGGEFFAAHIAGFNDLNPLEPVSGCVTDSEGNTTPECNILTGVYVAGSTVVPLPATVWLLSSGLFGLIAISRRKKML